jgi:hypothetical protein
MVRRSDVVFEYAGKYFLVPEGRNITVRMPKT